MIQFWGNKLFCALIALDKLLNIDFNQVFCGFIKELERRGKMHWKLPREIKRIVKYNHEVPQISLTMMSEESYDPTLQ